MNQELNAKMTAWHGATANPDDIPSHSSGNNNNNHDHDHPNITTGLPYTATAPNTAPTNHRNNTYSTIGFGTHSAIRKSYLDEVVAAQQQQQQQQQKRPLKKPNFLTPLLAAWTRRSRWTKKPTKAKDPTVPPIPPTPTLLPRFPFEPPRRRRGRHDEEAGDAGDADDADERAHAIATAATTAAIVLAEQEARAARRAGGGRAASMTAAVPPPPPPPLPSLLLPRAKAGPTTATDGATATATAVAVERWQRGVLRAEDASAGPRPPQRYLLHPPPPPSKAKAKAKAKPESERQLERRLCHAKSTTTVGAAGVAAVPPPGMHRHPAQRRGEERSSSIGGGGAGWRWGVGRRRSFGGDRTAAAAAVVGEEGFGSKFALDGDVDGDDGQQLRRGSLADLLPRRSKSAKEVGGGGGGKRVGRRKLRKRESGEVARGVEGGRREGPLHRRTLEVKRQDREQGEVEGYWRPEEVERWREEQRRSDGMERGAKTNEIGERKWSFEEERGRFGGNQEDEGSSGNRTERSRGRRLVRDDTSEVCREIVEANEALKKLQRAQKELRQVRHSVSKEGTPFFQHQQAEQELEREKRRQHQERRLRWPLQEREPEQEKAGARKCGHALTRSSSLKKIPGELLEGPHSSRQARAKQSPQVTFTRCSLRHEHHQNQQSRASTQGPRPEPAIPTGLFDFDFTSPFLPPHSPSQITRSPPVRRSFELQLPPVDSPEPPRKRGHATSAMISSFPTPPSVQHATTAATAADDDDDDDEEDSESCRDSADPASRLDAIHEETEDNDGAGSVRGETEDNNDSSASSGSSGPSTLELPEAMMPMAAAAAAASRSTLSVGDATVGASSVDSGGTVETAVTAVTEEGNGEVEVEVEEEETKLGKKGTVRLVPYADSDDEGGCKVEVGGRIFDPVEGEGEVERMETPPSVPRKKASQSRIPRPVVQEPQPKLDRATQEERLGLPLNTHAAKVAQAELGLVRQPVVKKKAGGKGQPRKSSFVEMV